ncbi:MAG: 2-amino-4-hydroxy-6-hydroxymethyldihydropteridine diphosphokinase [Gammaproteobacteria bacterium HGW-Gammaproteobacteria-14]|nr:MAG: 2-amino-4-hydroxy-6-hydroxymethyldihydropteridine diphosphokinase [Gammaproteobacteria bacterium HGW-Gammaproteobacteria-14]
MTEAFIGLGSNLGDSVDYLLFARQQLSSLADSQLVATSRLYRSAPVGPQDQPDFYNAVIQLNTSLAPIPLLDALQRIEQQAGRVRQRHWGERTLDLDILLYGDGTLNLPRLQVPHPQLGRRSFVLQPLSDIHPQLILPDGTPLTTLRDACSHQQICYHEDSRWRAGLER